MYKEKLKKKLYGGIYPYFWGDVLFVDKITRILNELGLSSIVINSPNAIDSLLKEEEAKIILEKLNL